MAATPTYMGTPFCPSAVISAANPNRNGTGTIIDMTVAPTGGARIDDIRIIATGTTTVGKVRMYRKSGGTYLFIDEFDVTAITASATVAPWAQDIYNLGQILEAGQCLAWSTEKAETFNIVVTRGGSA